jgi:hypothetical protein
LAEPIAAFYASYTGMKPKKERRRPREEASYTCDACGEEIEIVLDLSAGKSQQYVEDCPVCCRPNVIHVEIEDDGEARVSAEGE